MNKELALLDQIEEIRQRVAEHPENFPVDYVIRLCCSIVANAYRCKADDGKPILFGYILRQ